MLPQTFRALAGTGTSTVSRGTWNIATSLVTGSIEATISVSVLKKVSPCRWSTPTSRMFSRPLPSQAGSGASSVPWALLTGVSRGASDCVGVSVGPGPWLPVIESPGSGESAVSWHCASSLSLNTQPTRVDASMS